MLGGHIIDNWYRMTNNAYRKTLIKPGLLTGSNLAKNFKSPNLSKFKYDANMKYILNFTSKSPNIPVFI